jgi:hypothetical protein
LIGMARKRVFGFGLVKPSRSDLKTLCSRRVSSVVPFNSTLAPVYNLSPSGIFLVELHATKKIQTVIKNIFCQSLSIIVAADFD